MSRRTYQNRIDIYSPKQWCKQYATVHTINLRRLQRIIKRANEEAILEKKRAMDEMKQEVIGIASMMAQKVVSASIDTTIQDTLVEETLKEMGDSTWQN